MENEKRIRSVIRQMRRDARQYLGVTDYQNTPLTKIYHKLNQNKEYKRRRVAKAVRKGYSVKNQLNYELD